MQKMHLNLLKYFEMRIFKIVSSKKKFCLQIVQKKNFFLHNLQTNEQIEYWYTSLIL